MTLRRRYLLRVSGVDICGRLIRIEHDLLTFDDARQETAHFPKLYYSCSHEDHAAAALPDAPDFDHLIVGRPQIAMMRENQRKEIPCPT